MKREEEIRQKAISEQKSLMESCDWQAGFIAGAKLADKIMIDKACKWLEDYLYEYTNPQEFISTLCRYVHKKDAINEFRKAMEE